MFGFLARLIGMGAKLFSKIKPAIQGGVKLFNKGKSVYSAVKNTVSNIPVVGQIAQDYIKQGEDKLAALAKEKIGLTPSDITKGVDMADQMSRPPDGAPLEAKLNSLAK